MRAARTAGVGSHAAAHEEGGRSGGPAGSWVAFIWTVIEVFNPDQLSKLLALVGLRAYWLWWLARMKSRVLSDGRRRSVTAPPGPSGNLVLRDIQTQAVMPRCL